MKVRPTKIEAADLCPVWTGQPCGALVQHLVEINVARCQAGHELSGSEAWRWRRNGYVGSWMVR